MLLLGFKSSSGLVCLFHWNMRPLLTLSQYGVGPSEGIAMINLSLRRHLPGWFKSEAGDFYLTILFAAAATAELTYWCLSLPL